jgi:hypothetical protein
MSEEAFDGFEQGAADHVDAQPTADNTAGNAVEEPAKNKKNKKTEPDTPMKAAVKQALVVFMYS